MKVAKRILAAAVTAIAVAHLFAGCGRTEIFGIPPAPDAGPVDAADVFIPCEGDPRGAPGDPCTVDNPDGPCRGSYVCGDDNLLECFATQMAAPEQCNGVDDDCDGDVDEDFTAQDGRFTRFEHCGTCGNDCSTAFERADEVACDESRDPPGCIITRCPPGFVLENETLCVLEQPLLCLPCNDDDECRVSPGARCVELADIDGLTVINVCAQDCSPGAPFGACPAGFSCVSDPAGAFVDQCLPTGGSCSCNALPEGAQIACTIIGVGELTGDPIACPGQRTCQSGNPGPCVLPPEECDGVDQDCNGRIDDPFRDPVTGAYDVDPEHCGICGNDCTSTVFPNASSVCLGGAVPRCAPICEAGFRDVDGDESNGCECRFLGTVDEPDPDGVDANCDGIDGEVSNAIFVAPTGDDSNPGTIDRPLRNIQTGIQRAGAASVRDVLVAQGVYGENVILQNGVNTHGGYSQDFTARDLAQFETVVFGQPLGVGERGAVTANDITARTAFVGFTVFGIDANNLGESTYAMSLVDSTANLRVTHNRVVGGTGAPGSLGGRGNDGDNGAPGNRGGDGVAAGRNCSQPTIAGGGGGITSCAGVNTSGGRGGGSHCPITEMLDGTRPCNGTDDTTCKNTWDGTGAPPPTPPPQGVGQPGQPGGAPGGAATYDRWTNDNNCNLCGLAGGWPHIGDGGTNGQNGPNGLGGPGCANPSGTATATGWVGASGAPGSNGVNGAGAGGGSAGSGFDVTPGATGGNCSDRLGASGGGGGAGGCRGTGGTAGRSGGGSFAVWIGYTRARPSPPTLTDNTIQTGTGGPGGAGGVGGSGGNGGLGGNGGIAQPSVVFCAESGGRGGAGGDGGHGGGAGGGCGGVALGIAVVPGPNSFSLGYEMSNAFASGSGGTPGPGGASLGQPGGSGTPGAANDVLVF